MQLQTKIPLEPQSPKVDYNSNIVLLGSCFAENMAKKFDYFKFQNTLNPFGIIFHPLVLERLISKCQFEPFDYAQNKLHREQSGISTALDVTTDFKNDIFQHNEIWNSFNAHSQLSSTSKDQLIQNLETASETLTTSIVEASHIIITLGTAWGYVQKETNQVVANCHKLPQKNFVKKLFSVDKVTHSLKSISALIQKQNASAKIIFTVSPVRHIKDGFVENTRSKAHLISAVHQTISETSNTTYFPSYELMMDELRDYRFYNEDMLHPNETAINYIWERFTEVWLSSESISTSKKVEEIQRGLAHKSFNPNSEAHQKFLKHLQQKTEKLQKEFPQIKF